jgi:hypothetical protein
LAVAVFMAGATIRDMHSETPFDKAFEDNFVRLLEEIKKPVNEIA